MQEFVCPKCGAPLTEQQAQMSVITCAHCGVVFERQEAKPRGGITIQSSGTLKIGGDVVGGNLTHYHITHVPSDPSPQKPITIAASGDIEIGGNLVGGNHVSRNVALPPPLSRWDRIRAWFSRLFRRPKRKR